jgi:hypothetical protein
LNHGQAHSARLQNGQPDSCQAPVVVARVTKQDTVCVNNVWLKYLVNLENARQYNNMTQCSN